MKRRKFSFLIAIARKQGSEMDRTFWILVAVRICRSGSICCVGVYLCLITDWQKEVEKVAVRLAADRKLEGRHDAEA